MDQVNNSLTNVRAKWQGLSRPNKVGIISGIISVIIVIVVTFTLLTRVQYGVLFANVSQGDAGNITTTLKSQNIPYKLADGGTTILIPTDKVDQTRIDLAMSNKLPNSTQGFELFDKTNIMTTDQDRKIMYQRALTGELERSINTLNDVQASRVILVTPSQSVFDDGNNGKASASIILTLKGTTISNEEVQGIIALASSAVENLNPDNVKIVDSNGQVLADGNGDGDSGNSQLTGGNSKFLQAKMQYENELTQKLTQLLTPIYGAGKFQVALNVDLNFNAMEQNTVKYSNPNIRSENIQTTGPQAANQQQTGQPNNAANVTGNNNNNNSTFNRTINNELDTNTTKIITAPGSVQRITASVVLNANANNTANSQQVQAMVANAIGLNTQRGDSVNIQDVSFAKVPRPSTPKAPKASNLGWIIGGIAAGVVLLGSLITFIIMRARRKRREEEYEYEEEYETAPVMPEPVQIKEDAESEVESKTKQAKDFANKNPDIVADLVKTWVREEN